MINAGKQWLQDSSKCVMNMRQQQQQQQQQQQKLKIMCFPCRPINITNNKSYFNTSWQVIFLK